MSSPSAPPSTRRDDAAEQPRRRSVVASVATAASRHRLVTVVALIAVVLAGVWAFVVALDRQGFPAVETPIAVVQGSYVTAAGGQLAPQPPEVVDEEVVLPLLASFDDVDGVTSTSSEAFAGGFFVVVEFEDGIASGDGAARLEEAAPAPPDGAQVSYVPVSAASFVGQYDLLVSVIGPDGATPEELQTQADDVAAALVELETVAIAESRPLVSEVTDPATGATAQAQTRFTRVVLDEGGPFRAGVTVGLDQVEGAEADVLEYSDAVEAALDDLELADGYEARITADFAVGIRQQLGSLTENLGTGLLAVALVSLVLIGWRASTITAGFMVVVLLGALVGLWLVGFSLNTITLFGLILTLGLLVDDAIVISESIDANRDDPDPGEDDRDLGVIRTALARVGAASLSGTLTTVAVFSPLLFVGGILGDFIRPIPTTVIITLLGSFVFSVVFIPAVARGVLTGRDARPNPVVRQVQALARATGRLAAYPSGNGARGVAVGAVLALVSVGAVVVGGALAASLGFAIFPAGKDAVQLVVTGELPPGTSLEQAQAIADDVDADLQDVLGDGLVGAQYTRGDERGLEIFIDLSPIDERQTTAPSYVEQLQDRFDEYDEARLTAAQIEIGPPTDEYPFAAQVAVDDDTAEAGRDLVAELRDFLVGQEVAVDASASSFAEITDAVVSTDGSVARTDGARYVEVRAAFDDATSVTALTQNTQELIEDEFGDSLTERGLPPDALQFDFGFESDNQEDFAALGLAGVVALGLMLLLLAVQFRSVAQPLLIFLAIPFSFLGVFALLGATDNPLSFLVAVGFIALIGVAVNNTILVVEAANRAREGGATAAEAIRDAVERRFRPLVATTLTTVVGLLPLALSDPFWESLGFTLIGGLISSTVLVLVSFPAFYLALEAARTPLRNAVRRRRGRPELA